MEKTKLIRYARNLRQNCSDAERNLWYWLRANRLGFKFKRQVPIGKYIVDFVCIEMRLIIELDGGQHQTQFAYDTERTCWLNKRGFKVLRFWNHEVLKDIDVVLEVIIKALSPNPSPAN